MNEELALALYDIGAIKTGEFTLASGQKSPVYIDLRQLVSYPHVLKMVSETIWQQAKASNPDLICGVPYTALPIATVISVDHDQPMIMIRKEAKKYGTKKLIEGSYQEGQSCLMIEDLVTTGGSAIKAAQQLQEEGLKVMDIAVLLDREQGGPENVKEAGFNLHAAFKVSELFDVLNKHNKFDDEQWSKIQSFLES